MRAGLRHSLCLALASIFAGLLFGAPASAQQQDLEPAVKATFVLRFASFVQWPAESFPAQTDPIVICVAGDARFAALVESAASGERIGVHSVVVRRLAAVPREAGCHVLYAAGAPGQNVAQMLESVRGHAVLTVTDQLHSGTRGMIHFVREGGRVRFHIDRDAADGAGLTVNSRLLAVALTVRSRRAS